MGSASSTLTAARVALLISLAALLPAGAQPTAMPSCDLLAACHDPATCPALSGVRASVGCMLFSAHGCQPQRVLKCALRRDATRNIFRHVQDNSRKLHHHDGHCMGPSLRSALLASREVGFGLPASRTGERERVRARERARAREDGMRERLSRWLSDPTYFSWSVGRIGYVRDWGPFSKS